MRTGLEALIRDHLGIAHAIAAQIWRTAPNSLELDELKSIANYGLVTAATRWPTYCQENGFDPGRLEYFKPYATRRIRGAVFDSLRSSDWATRSMRAKAKQLQEAGQGEGVSERELAERTGLKISEVRATTSGMAARPVSLDADDLDLGAPVAVEDQASSNVLLGEFTRAVAALAFDQQVLIVLKYYEGLELRDVARAMGVTESRASHLHTTSVLAIYDVLRAFVGDGE